jgi:hypothetical protein
MIKQCNLLTPWERASLVNERTALAMV